MASAQQKSIFSPSGNPAGSVSQQDSARYTAELLESLRKMAAQQDQPLLAHLLELAWTEARILARTG